MIEKTISNGKLIQTQYRVPLWPLFTARSEHLHIPLITVFCSIMYFNRESYLGSCAKLEI